MRGVCLGGMVWFEDGRLVLWCDAACRSLAGSDARDAGFAVCGFPTNRVPETFNVFADANPFQVSSSAAW